MAKETRYFAWKDGKQADGQTQEWTEISKQEYLKISADNANSAASQRRFFVRVPGTEDEDTCFWLECNHEQYKKDRAEKEQKKRKKKLHKNDASKYGSIRRLSLDAKYLDFSGDPYTLHEQVADETSLFEDSLVDRIAVESALAQLNSQERNLIEALFSNGDKKMNENRLSHQIHVPQKTINNRKRRIYEKLKNFLAKN